jgi:DNA repair protein RadC
MADNVHKDHRKRLRQRYLAEGLDHFQEHEALELALFYVFPQGDTNALAHRLIDTFGSLSAVFDADPEALQQVQGIGDKAAVFLNMMSSMLRQYMKDKNNIINAKLTPNNTVQYIRSLFWGRTCEEFYVICLDASNRVINTKMICRGTVTQAPVNIRTILQAVLNNNAVSVILAHNHPGGLSMPSKEDREVTKTLQYLLSFVEVKVLDHIIISEADYISFAFDLHEL